MSFFIIGNTSSSFLLSFTRFYVDVAAKGITSKKCISWSDIIDFPHIFQTYVCILTADFFFTSKNLITFQSQMLNKTENSHIMGLSRKDITSLVFKTVNTCKSFKSTKDLRVHLLNKNVMKQMLKVLDSKQGKKLMPKKRPILNRFLPNDKKMTKEDVSIVSEHVGEFCT